MTMSDDFELSREDQVKLQKIIDREVEVELELSGQTGACYISVYGLPTSCHNGMTLRSCARVAANVGGTSRFVPGGKC